MARWNRENPRSRPAERVVGLDGEGQTQADGVHRYTYLAAADEGGVEWATEGHGEGGRVTTREWLDFVLNLPGRTLVFGYAFLYDITKGLEDLPDRKVFDLVHEDRREMLIDGRVVHRAVRWRGYRINYMNRRITVERGRRRRTVWDVFGFFQSKFVKALTDWKVGTDEERALLAAMKDRRGGASWKDGKKVREYCRLECRLLAQLGRKLISAHEDAGLQLKSYFGAGSTASALLKKFGVKEMRGEVPEAMREPLATAFFGGRFENSRLGPVPGPVENADICSAYPYAATFLPCLACGKWEKVPARRAEGALATARLALCRWRSRDLSRPDAPWGVLPVRKADGTIAFPLSAPEGGWTWGPEFAAARALNPDVELMEVWTYRTDCAHAPFAELPWYYNERVRVGKDGVGIVFKLGPNSVYGKVAQSRGLRPPFQSWAWAGSITSDTRAMLLRALAAARDPASVVMFATDGVWSTEKLALPEPRATGTGGVAGPDGEVKPALGAWEQKTFERGVFLVRPGIYFPIAPTDDELEKVRARGLGRSVLYKNWRKIVRAHAAGADGVEIEAGTRFVGAKTGVRLSERTGKCERSPRLGQWVPHKVNVGFDPRPKRAAVLPGGALAPWPRFDWPSVPYDDAMKSDEARLLALAQITAEEQPDADYSEVE